MATLRLMLALILAFCLPVSWSADTLTLRDGTNGYQGTRDTTLYQDRPNNSNGGGEDFFSGDTQTNSTRRALIAFDVAPLPNNAVITGVSLKLTVSRSRPGATTYTLHRVLADWGEGSVVAEDPGGLGAPADPGDATWNENFHEASAWIVPGGDFAPAPSASAVVPQSGTAVFSGEGLVNDIRAWAAGDAPNFGWVLIGDEAGSWNAKRFVASEGPLADRPQLRIEFERLAATADAWLRYR